MVDFNDCNKTLGDFRGKIVLICNSDTANICDSQNIQTINDNFKKLEDSVLEDDNRLLITISESDEISDKIREIIKKEAITNVGCIRIQHPMSESVNFNRDVIKLNIRQVHARKMKIENDNRVSSVFFCYLFIYDLFKYLKRLLLYCFLLFAFYIYLYINIINYEN